MSRPAKVSGLARASLRGGLRSLPERLMLRRSGALWQTAGAPLGRAVSI